MSEERIIPQDEPADDGPLLTGENSQNLVDTKLQTANMETHHAHHITHKKKWTEYLLEFFMLFLAVFLGFVAENFRENLIEHSKEKEYIQSLLADIKQDTAEINKSKLTASKALAYEDSLIFYLYNKTPGSFLPENFLNVDFNAMLRLKLVFNVATAQQLKNSGNMRLIRNTEVLGKITIYWNEQENTMISLSRYLEYRNRGREFSEKLFAFSDYDLIDAKLITPSGKGVRVIQSNPDMWSEYSNIISHCHITVLNYLAQLEKLKGETKDLIQLLQKEYHLENK